MPDRTQYRPGTPSWVDLATPDVEAAARFYGELLGWDAREAGPAEETGGYRLFSLQGRTVAGLGPLQDEAQPPAWTTYVTVADADASAAAVREAGGRVLMEPFDVLDAGRMAVFQDPAGAVAALWEPRGSIGAELVDEPGALSWTELACREPGKARDFYAALFGWKAESQPQGGVDYTVWKLGDEMVAGMIQMNEQWPAEIAPHWMAYFAVEDVDGTARRAEELGGRVEVPPADIPVGRFTVLADPQGAVFTAIGLNPAQVAG